jgi:hypothetical protein
LFSNAVSRLQIVSDISLHSKAQAAPPIVSLRASNAMLFDGRIAQD